MFVYRIDTNLTKQQAQVIYENLTLEEIEDIESFNIRACDIEINGLITSFVITTRQVLVRIILFLRQKQISFSYEDISEQVLVGEIEFNESDFQSRIIDFVRENLTVDSVLDRINKYGFENLKDFEIEFLNSIK